MITIDDFLKVEMKVGEILSVETIPESEKLLKLSVDFGEENPRQVLSGISKFFPDGHVLVGKRCAFVTNLAPRMMMGLESQAMILAASSDETICLFQVEKTIPVGTKIK